MEVIYVDELIACTTDGIKVDGVPTEIKILPLGLVKTQKGDFNVDDESVDMIIKQFKDRQLDLVIDYEHQTLENIQAPAGGWIKDIYKGDGCLIAKVDWTSKAKEYLTNKEYKYLSPVVIVRKKDNKATSIHSVALTNTPAIDGMYAIVNSNKVQLSKGETNMISKELALLLGLTETATEDEIKEAIGKLVNATKEDKKDDPKSEEVVEENKDKCDTQVVANSVVLELLGLKEGAKTEEVAATIMALKAGDIKTAQEVLVLKEKIANREADESVSKALKEGKITAAQKEWAKAYALKDSEGFKNFVDKAPVVVPTGTMELVDSPVKQEYDVQILKNLGVSEDDVKKFYN